VAGGFSDLSSGAFVNGTAVAARDFEDGQRQQNKGVRIRDNRKP